MRQKRVRTLRGEERRAGEDEGRGEEEKNGKASSVA